jgi:nitrite reductase (NADH) small subunit
MAWTSLCEVGEVPAGGGKYVEIDGYRLAVFLHQGKPYVMDDYCPHAGGPMSAGWVDAEDACAVCPFHGWAFKLDSGALLNQPLLKIAVYPARLYPRAGQADLIQADLPMP